MINLSTNTNNPYLQNSVNTSSNTVSEEQQNNQPDLKAQIEQSAVEVSISMNAQIVLFSMDVEDLNRDNVSAQKDIFDFLSGKEDSEGFTLSDIGYEGKPITELSQEEASELVSENGFFGVEQTSSRVSDFVLGFAGDNIEALEQSIEGVIRGFEDAQRLWGGELPEISYQTQERTLDILNTRLEELRGDNNPTNDTQ